MSKIKPRGKVPKKASVDEIIEIKTLIRHPMHSGRMKDKNGKNIPKRIINKFGAVSEECCLSMVKNLTKISKSQINVSVTGIAGPKGGSKFKPVGLVYIGINYKGKNNIYKYSFANKTRRSIQNASAKAVVDNLLNLIK